MRRGLLVVISLLVLLVSVIGLSGCYGYYTCTKRDSDNPDYIEDFALEYGFEDYLQYETDYWQARNLYSFIDQSQGLEPDRDYVMLVEWDDNLLQLFFTSVCEEYDPVFYEVVFPTPWEMERILSAYRDASEHDITVIGSDEITKDQYSFYTFARSFEYHSPFQYHIGTWIDDDTKKELYMMKTSEQEFAIVSIYQKDVGHTLDELLFFSEADLLDDTELTICDITEEYCLIISMRPEETLRD